MPLWISSCISMQSRNYDNRLCYRYGGMPEGEGPYRGMVFVKTGSFVFGNDQGHQDRESGNFDLLYEESGSYTAKVDGFWIDRHEVTNAQFQQFVDETGYQTIAERPHQTLGSPFTPGSAVFLPPSFLPQEGDIERWWTLVDGANWRHPLGPNSDIADKMNHPVVHIAYQDAQAYANWAGKQLPTEAQWEYAAKGHLKNKTYTWGNTLRPNNQWMANTFQGSFPTNDAGEDGFVGTAPVGCYPPNSFGLYDMAGNVWEIVSDFYQPTHNKSALINPTGPDKSFDPRDPKSHKHVIKGGSFLCSPDYCMRYRPSARQGQDSTLSTNHIGFRLVKNN